MDEFSFLRYHTEYSCKGFISKDMSPSACFGYVFDRIIDDKPEEYKIVIYLGTKYCKEYNESNACLLTEQEVYRHVKLLNSLYPIRVSVSDISTNVLERFLITLNIENAPATFHRYALSWVRYLYEFPYNVFLRDAYTLKKNPTFRFESIANLFNLILGCYTYNTSELHQIPNNGHSVRLKLAELREKIKEVRYLNDIYFHTAKKYTIPKRINGFSLTDLEYWNVGFSKRAPIYIKTYKEKVK